MAVDEIGTAFVRLGLSIGRHVPGYVDSYGGRHRPSVEAEGSPLLPRGSADRLAAEVAAIQLSSRPAARICSVRSRRCTRPCAPPG
jgi:hypothetical protein